MSLSTQREFKIIMHNELNLHPYACVFPNDDTKGLYVEWPDMQDGSLSYRMRNVFIQPDSYHNLPVMNERPLCESAERSKIKRRVINRPVALNDLHVHVEKNRNESISRTLPV